MSSHKETNGIEISHVELSDEESVEFVDEMRDTNDVSSVDRATKKRKNSSEVHPHFVDIEAERDRQLEDVTSKLKTLFEKYLHTFKASKVATSCSTASTSSVEPPIVGDDFLTYLKSRPIETGLKTELELYLEEPNFTSEEAKFDVLKWWSHYSSKFPILSKMAKDIFCIPITTVASESAFSAGGRILDDYRSSLSKDMVEILVCGSDWLKAVSKTTIQTLQQSAEEEENLEIDMLIRDGCPDN
ncbi:hypothetical protein QVD17_42033 [Tagetes erecta]|uniref:HAT C-terminal dimerisation domain-containing protein n=1 Tax=Tagetes erecta TaxID=13708 RepID=A0AAD8NF60_TARER|nr:hypothetical protein QVD17_42033 [Tagetes erecta]